MRPTVLLFDIDGTLVTTGGVGRRSLELTFARLHGRDDACSHFDFSGMTDRAIAREGLRFIGLEPTEQRIDALLDGYLSVLREEVKQSDPTKYRVHPGMREAVESALASSDYAVGLGTGNIRLGAQVKLEHVDLYRHFSFGGFGCDAENRTELIRCGAQRGADKLGAPLAECRVVIIGDTPKDVAAAHGIGAECIGVGTGHFTAEQLRESGADHWYPDLAQPGAIDVLLGRA